MNTKTKKQRSRERKHSQLISLFLQLDQEGGSRMALWEAMEKKTGYSREYITRVLRNHGINYQKQAIGDGN